MGQFSYKRVIYKGFNNKIEGLSRTAFEMFITSCSISIRIADCSTQGTQLIKKYPYVLREIDKGGNQSGEPSPDAALGVDMDIAFLNVCEFLMINIEGEEEKWKRKSTIQL